MDIILGVLYAVGLALMCTAGTVYWGNGSKLIALWFFVAGTVWIVLTAGAQTHQVISRDETAPLSPEAAAQRIVVAAQTAIQRAWLSVTPQIAGEIGKDKPINIGLVAENVGHEPATGVSHHGITMMFDMPDQIAYAPEIWSPEFQQVIKLECDLAQPVKGRTTIFPGHKPMLEARWNNKQDISDLVDGKKILVTFGCVGYFTKGDEAHFTWYCFFLMRGHGKWQVGSAPIGNDAN